MLLCLFLYLKGSAWSLSNTEADTYEHDAHGALFLTIGWSRTIELKGAIAHFKRLFSDGRYAAGGSAYVA